MTKLWELEKTVEVEFTVETAIYRFRLEAQKSGQEQGKYRIRLFEYDLFRIRPTFGGYPEDGADHEIQFAANLSIDGQEYRAASADDALQMAIDRLRKQLFV
ncbi:MAG: hypothetical protein E5W57_25910 [Mesorhizobium sp.]|nr:MAG: hypothetical protein E5W57_25910 [Mesorhizobium sp.]